MTPTLRFATFLAPNVLPVYQCVADYVGRQLGFQTEIVIGSSFDQFARGQVDLGFICGQPYVRLARQVPAPVEPIAAPVLVGERYAGRPIYFSDVIVRRGSPFRAFADLRGRSWAFNDRDSHSGYALPRYALSRIGETWEFFGRIVEAGLHQRAIRLVVSGAVDGAAIDSQVLAIELRDHPELADELRTIDVFGPSPIQPLVASRRLPPGLREMLRETVVAIGDDPRARNALAYGLVERFVPVTDADYDEIRRMLVAADAAGVGVPG